MREITRYLELQGPRLSREVTDRLYQNPFWTERFGARGRRHADDDGDYHLRYVMQALESRDPGLVVHYARWLQGVLVNRGMCSRHLEDNFRLLAEALRKDGAPGIPAAEREEAVSLFERGARALRYSVPGAAEVQERLAELARTAVDALWRAHPDWFPKESARARGEDDAGYHLSYVADASAAGRDQPFVEYVTWVVGFLEKFQVPRAHTVAMLQALHRACGELTPNAATEARVVLQAGLTALGAPPE